MVSNLKAEVALDKDAEKAAEALNKARLVEERTQALDRDLLGVKYTLESNSKVLVNISDSLDKTILSIEKTNEILRTFSGVHKFMETTDSEFKKLEETIDKRKESNDET